LSPWRSARFHDDRRRMIIILTVLVNIHFSALQLAYPSNQYGALSCHPGGDSNALEGINPFETRGSAKMTDYHV